MTNVEMVAKDALAGLVGISLLSAAVLKRAIQIESKHPTPRAGLIRVLRQALRARERADAGAPRSVA